MLVKSFSRCDQTDELISAIFGEHHNSANTIIDKFNFLSDRAALSYAALNIRPMINFVTVSISLPEQYQDITEEYKVAETDYFETIKKTSLPLSALENHKKMVILKARSKKSPTVKCKCCGGKIPTDALNSLECPICGDKKFLATPTTVVKIQRLFDELAAINSTIHEKIAALDAVTNKAIAKATSNDVKITYNHHIYK